MLMQSVAQNLRVPFLTTQPRAFYFSKKRNQTSRDPKNYISRTEYTALYALPTAVGRTVWKSQGKLIYGVLRYADKGPRQPLCSPDKMSCIAQLLHVPPDPGGPVVTRLPSFSSSTKLNFS